ncbi:MAG: hypothetical protein EPN46_12500 [Candidimonas sp.]|nr:MAG: hypothetical protein EPN62_11275 [Candidimonas sp.]TAM74466.1 MAG: hypothetical protein EPN46_12500 [Candidimonas sp.]
MNQAVEKSTAISHFIDTAKQADAGGMTRQKLDVVLKALIDLAAHKDWWSNDDYPEPVDGDLQSRYMVHEEPDNTYALYLNVMRPGKAIVPHNHTTWACIAAVRGTETNYVYDRLDDKSKPGVARLALVKEQPVSPGGGIALMADDIHAVRIEDESGIRHLHMYGVSLEMLTERVAFDTENNTCKLMSIGVKTKRSAA